MQKQYDTLPTGLPDWNGEAIDDFDLPDYMFKDPIHYSEEWFSFIEEKVKDENLADEYKQIMINIMHKRHGVDVRLSLTIFIYIIAHGFTVIVSEFEKIVKDVAEFKSWGVSEVEAMKSRIDNLVINATGTNIAEVVDARMSIDGSVQTTLGNRLLKDFTDRLTKAQLIKFIAGEDIEVTVKSDFTGKIAGSIVENANKILGQNAATVQLPSAFTSEASQTGYDLVKLLDGKNYNARYTANTIIAQQLISFDALWILEQNFPSIFKNATTTAEKVAIAKSKIKKFQYKGWAKASGPTGTLCSHSMFNPISALWVATATSTGDTIIERSIGSANVSTSAYLNADGFYYFAVYAEPSNGTTASSVSIDYASMELTVKFNISDFVATKDQYDALKKVVDDHVADAVKHITAAERIKWNAKQDVSTLSRNTILWSGGLMMTGEHIITPSVALDKCENGWMIRFARYNPATAVRDDAYSVYVFIPKASVSIATDLPHAGESSSFSRKLLDVTNTTIRGKDGNQNSSPTGAVYRMIAVEVKSI